MMRIAFVTSRLIRRSAAADQRRHSAGDHGNRRGKKGPFATRDKPMPEEPKKEPVVLSKRDKRIGVLRLDKARLEDRNNHWMKGYENLVSLLADCRCDVQRGILHGKIRSVAEKVDENTKTLNKVEWELVSLGEVIGGLADVSGGGGDVSGGGCDVTGGAGGVDGTGGGGEGTCGGDVVGDGEVGGGGI